VEATLMKIVSVAALYLFFAGLAFGECVTIETRKPLPSSGTVRIDAFVDGKPRPDATLEVFLTDKERIASLRTDIHGNAVLPPLKPGFYSIFASSGEDLRAELYLEVLGNAKNEMGAFSLELVSFPDTQAALRTAKTMPAGKQIQEFKGVVEDQSGAAVPKALIWIIRRGDTKDAKAIAIKADDSGHFSSPLSVGTYVVLVQSQGFRSEILVFEIAKNGQPKELHALLKVASC
jgi:hypothetical protein